MLPIVLASTSIYRRELLSRLGLEFESRAPDFDEDSFKSLDLSPLELAKTLSRGKARSLATGTNCVIGGDQLVALDGQILGKPKTAAKAQAQLEMMSGKTHELITAVTVIYAKEEFEIVDRAQMTLRDLTPELIRRYLQADQPWDCAGSYKIEHRGITLFSSIRCEDFTAIPGLPLIKLTSLLASKGYPV